MFIRGNAANYFHKVIDEATNLGASPKCTPLPGVADTRDAWIVAASYISTTDTALHPIYYIERLASAQQGNSWGAFENKVDRRRGTPRPYDWGHMLSPTSPQQSRHPPYYSF